MAEDYAVVGETTESINHEILAYDNETMHEWADELENHLQWLARLEYHAGCYDFGIRGKLIYADVNGKDPRHKQEVYGKLAKEPALAVKFEEATSAMKGLVTFLNGGLESPEALEGLESLDESPPLLVDAMRTSQLEPEIVNYLLQLKDKEGTQKLLNFLSHQSRRKTARPVMLLLGMIDKAQTDKRGLTEGWAIGYDFLTGLLIIKPFYSKKDHHPLGETWHSNFPDDGVSFRGTPAVFAKNFVDLGKQTRRGTGNNGSKLVVHSLVVEWILRQWKGLSSIEPNVWTKEFKKNIKEATEKIDPILEKIPTAFKEKTSEQKLPMEAFEVLEKQLTAEDWFFRSSAMEAREKGNEEAAQNAAVFYERLVKDLNLFNENPKNRF